MAETTETEDAVRIKSPSIRIQDKMQGLYDSKRAQQLFMISSIGTGIFDLLTVYCSLFVCPLMNLNDLTNDQ